MNIVDLINSGETIIISKYGIEDFMTIDITLTRHRTMQCRLQKRLKDDMSDLGIKRCINNLRLQLEKHVEETRI